VIGGLTPPRSPSSETSLSSPVTVLCWLILKEIELPNCQRSNANVSFAAYSYGKQNQMVHRRKKIFANQPQSRFRDASTQHASANYLVRRRHWEGLSIYQKPSVRQHPLLPNRKSCQFILANPVIGYVRNRSHVATKGKLSAPGSKDG
jgi:hypothetical protein